MTRSVTLFVRDILQNISDAMEFVEGISYGQFVADKKTLNAVLRSIKVIGEASKNIPDDVRLRYPQIPWKQMSGMRDKDIHSYFGVDLETVWLVTKNRIPAMSVPEMSPGRCFTTTQE